MRSLGYVTVIMLCLCIVCLPAKAETDDFEIPVPERHRFGQVNAVMPWRKAVLVSGHLNVALFSADCPPKYLNNIVLKNIHVNAAVTCVMVRGEDAFLLVSDTGILYPLIEETHTLTVGSPFFFDTAPLVLEDTLGRKRTLPLEQALLCGDYLCLLSRNMSFHGTKLALISLDGASADVLHSDRNLFIEAICAYDEHSLLALASYRESEQATQVMKIDLRTGQSSPFITLKAKRHELGRSIYWDSANQCLYLRSGPEVVSWSETKGEQSCAYFSVSAERNIVSGKLGMDDSGQLVSAWSSGLMYREATASASGGRPLVICGIDDTDAAHLYAQYRLGKTPIHITSTENMTSLEYLSTAFIAGNSEPDIFFIVSDEMDIRALLKKGYAANLSDQLSLVSHVRSCAPEFTGLSCHEQTLYLIPVGVLTDTISVNIHLLNNMKIKPPRTFEQLCQLFASWPELSDDYPNQTVLTRGNPETVLLHHGLLLYMMQITSENQPLTFNTQLFRALFSHFQANRPSIKAIEPPNNTLQELALPLFKYTDSDLVNWTHYYRSQSSDTPWLNGAYRPVMLTVDDHAAPHVPVRVVYAGVSVHSQQPQIAKKYLSEYVAGLSQQAKIKLQPGPHKPVKNTQIQGAIASNMEHLRLLRSALAIAQGAEATQLRSHIDTVAQRIRKLSDTAYTIDAQSLASLDAIRPCCTLLTWQNTLGSATESIQDIWLRYQQEQIDLEQFIQYADDILRLSQGESN